MLEVNFTCDNCSIKETTTLQGGYLFGGRITAQAPLQAGLNQLCQNCYFHALDLLKQEKEEFAK